MTLSDGLKVSLDSFEGWMDFVKELQGLHEETWNSSIQPGKWTIKDIVCHIMLWDKYFYENAIIKIVQGDELTIKHIDFDEFNLGAITYAKTISTDELIHQSIYYRTEIIHAIRALSKDVVEQMYHDANGEVFYIPQYVKDFIWHDDHHMNQMKDFLKL